MSTQTLRVTAEESGHSLADILRTRLSLSWSEARRLIQSQQVRLNGRPCLDPSRRVARGQRLEVSRPEVKGTATPVKFESGRPQIRYLDEVVVVVEKPFGLTTMRHPEDIEEFGRRAKRFLPPTLADVLPSLLSAQRVSGSTKVWAVHRLDKDTSGLVVFVRTAEAERSLSQQFREHSTERRYLAIVRGRAANGRVESNLIRDRGDGRRGSSSRTDEGKHAVTHVRVVEDLGDYTLVECRLETGRTHQVRIHLGEAGTPICGERIYDRPLHGKPVPDESAAPRLALHAASLGFTHPTTGKRMNWNSTLPRELAELLNRLRPKKASRERQRPEK